MEDAVANTGTALLDLICTLGHRTRGVGELLRASVPPEQLLSGDPASLSVLPRGTAQRLLAVRGDDPRPARDSLLQALSDCGARLLPIHDRCYPAPLREIPDPPPWLFCRGDPALLDRPTVAIVGSRRASHAGLTLAGRLAESLAGGGYCIGSGLALGIDAAAHRGALRAGHTVAVLGTGIDRCYPSSHAALADDIVARGCLLSELPPNTAPHRGQFPRRNRIISGLAQSTVIVEAALPSGSLHTAAAALEQGREVFTLPWSVLHRGGAGCLYLLRDGATPLTRLDELEEHFPLLGSAPPLEAMDRRLLTLIGDGYPTLEALAESTGAAVPDLLSRLGRLELQGQVLRRDGGYALAIAGARGG